MERDYFMEQAEFLKKDLGKQNISQKLFQRLKELIMDGKLPPGYMMPNENVVSELLGVGRSTLREAYTALAVFGFIRRSKAGTFVNEIDNMIFNMLVYIDFDKIGKENSENNIDLKTAEKIYFSDKQCTITIYMVCKLLQKNSSHKE